MALIGFELIIGFIGMCLILIAFLMDQMHKWNSDSIQYDGFNFVGSALMCYYAFFIPSYPFLGLNLIWALISFKDLIKGKFLKKKK
jgi:hypothetical protein